MTRIQGVSGASLADSYDAIGDQVHVDELRDAEGVALVHDLSRSTFTERLSAFVRLGTAQAVAQSSTFDVTIPDLPNIGRIAQIQVVQGSTSTDQFCTSVQVSLLTDGPTAREIPLYVCQSTDPRKVIRLNVEGTLQNWLLLPNAILSPLPLLSVGQAQQEGLRAPSLVMRGVTGAFGAGTLDFHCLALVYFAELRGNASGRLGSQGVGIPSW